MLAPAARPQVFVWGPGPKLPAATAAATGVPPPASAATTAAPALGFPCAGDQDTQCPFGRCIEGRCGGCASAEACKPGSVCALTSFGQACLPGATASTAASPGAAPTTTATPSAPASAPTPADPNERARALCAQRTNEYRARVGSAPLGRSTAAESCADGQARRDGQSRTVHGSFGGCREAAQNECPGWDGLLEEVIDRCLAMMFAEGPGAGPAHGHYTNMTDRRYRSVACGVAMVGGEVWIVQNFFR